MVDFGGKTPIPQSSINSSDPDVFTFPIEPYEDSREVGKKNLSKSNEELNIRIDSIFDYKSETKDNKVKENQNIKKQITDLAESQTLESFLSETLSATLSTTFNEEIPETKAIFSKKFMEETTNPDQFFIQNKKIVLFKTEMCRSFTELGICKYGHNCQFCHDRRELRVVQRHPKYKTEICKTFWNEGSCPYGSRCCFIHKEKSIKEDEKAVIEKTINEKAVIDKTQAISQKQPMNSQKVKSKAQKEISKKTIQENKATSFELTIATENLTEEIEFNEIDKEMPKKCLNTINKIVRKEESIPAVLNNYIPILEDSLDNFVNARNLETIKFHACPFPLPNSVFSFSQPENKKDFSGENVIEIWTDEPVFYIKKSDREINL